MDNANLSAALASAPAAEAPQPRLKAINRRQMRLHPVEVERLVEADHAVRAIWDLIAISSMATALKATSALAAS